MAFNYRVAERTKRHFIDFFQKLFKRYEENKVNFSDSYYNISFSKIPKCQAVDTYDFKYYPIVLVGISSIATRDCGINKFRGYYDDGGGTVSATYGGFATVTLNFQVRARSEDERNNLADTVIMYIDSVETKKAFNDILGIRIIGSPTFGGESVDDDPQTNVKQFVTNVTQVIETDYEEDQNILDTFGNPSVILNDIISHTNIDVYEYIDGLKDLGYTDSQIISALKTKYNLTDDEAEEKLDLYYSGDKELYV